MFEGVSIKPPEGYEGYSQSPHESVLTMATRGGVIRALKGTPVPDFSASIPDGFSSENFDIHDPEAQGLAQRLWGEFLRYVELRRVEERETLELHQGPYPFNVPKGHPVDRTAIQRRQNSRMFALAESLLQKNSEVSPGDLHAEMIRLAATEPLGQELSQTEKAAAFLISFAYAGSGARGVIDAYRRKSGDKEGPPRSKTPPPDAMAA